VIGLVGPLGAGKTQLAKGLGEGLGLDDPSRMCSPTFVLECEYAGRVPIRHLDAYRLGNFADLEALGFAEMRDDAVVLVEWADRVREALPDETLWIELAVTGAATRRLELGTRFADFAARLARAGLDRWTQAAL
jgi:tRNA threonylcarbamoyladenosine biosynthesis protein TsaE